MMFTPLLPALLRRLFKRYPAFLAIYGLRDTSTPWISVTVSPRSPIPLWITIYRLSLGLAWCSDD